MSEELSGKQILEQINATLVNFKREVSEDINGLKSNIKEGTDRTLAAHEGTRRHVVRLTKMVGEVWKEVYGSKPPPPPPGKDAELSFALSDEDDTRTTKTGEEEPEKPRMFEQVSEHDSTLEGLHAQIIVTDGRTAKVEETVGELLKLQKEQMGKKNPDDERGVLRRLVDGMLWGIKEREGQKFLLTMVASITGLITALGTTYALMTGRLPMPNSVPNPPALHQPASSNDR